MIYAQFYVKDLTGKLAEGVGDRAVLVLDGRERRGYHHEHARTWAEKHKFLGYRLMRGERFTSGVPIGQYVPVGEQP